ncbi:unnamed protein product, partial [Heterotrigona itama]
MGNIVKCFGTTGRSNSKHSQMPHASSWNVISTQAVEKTEERRKEGERGRRMRGKKKEKRAQEDVSFYWVESLS